MTIETSEQTAVLTLNRPEKYNALNDAMINQLHQALTDIAHNDDIRVVVLTGTGKAFAAGADIAQYEQATAADFANFTTRCNSLCDRISTLPIPVIAAVNGIALGGGFEIVLACDFVIAADTAAFGLPEVSLGLLPGWGGTQRLSAFIGTSRAKAMIMTASKLTAGQALDAGIVLEVHTTGTELIRARELATDIARRAPLAIAAIKTSVNHAAGAIPGNTGPGFALEQSLLRELFATDDGREGIRAFVDKRPATFVGH
ncbi:enoyl-CoA hydratase/isomerase family protein [Rhodococcus fascians]|nr:enoyl-CoA hydratase/isomerase family protein [Rhodococcus fascians]MBY4238647.1 enoyl-CoA hydratase/isomerase family protein [Rhodococcus fascians]MBY4254764.1 enoyl-CoA hydratase/isomerase family protein [Rhodococcus fascians]MBY4270002.1 enoyl-CoA hydratase/isomerase family protein [Rhodococcus fascians]